MSAGSVEVKGLREIERKLLSMERKVARKVVRRGLRKGAKVVLTAVKRNVPVRSGRLKRSLKVRSMKRQRKGSHAIGVGAAGGDGFYGAFVALGHKIGKRRGGRKTRGQGGRRGKVRARPFLRLSVLQVGDAAKRTAIEEIRSGIEAEARKP